MHKDTLMDKHTFDSLDRLLNYIYDGEHKHWQESGRPKDHIFNDIKIISGWVDKKLSAEPKGEVVIEY